MSNSVTRLPNLLVNRLYLNLRVMALPHPLETSKDIDITEPNFAQNQFLGNIGAPLEPNWWSTQFDEDEELQEESLDGHAESVVSGSRDGITTLVPVVSALVFLSYRNTITQFLGL